MSAEPVIAGMETKSISLPTVQNERILSLDVLRGFALLGILVMNIQSFATIDAAYLNPTAYGDLTGADGWIWYCSHLLADLKFMGLFSMLFGAGIVLMAERCQSRGDLPARLHYRRMSGLLLIGLAHAYLLWSGDILVPYAICGSFAFLAWRLSTKWLAAIGMASFLVGGLIWLILGFAVSLASPSELAEMEGGQWQPDAATIASELEDFRGPWLQQQQRRMTDSFGAQLILLPILFWRICGLMWIGMALFRSGLLTADRTDKAYQFMAILGMSIGLPVIALGANWNIQQEWAIQYSLFLGSLPNYLGSLFVSLAYIGIVIWLLRSRVGGFLQAGLAPVGRLALTNYLGQSVICTSIFYGHGLGWYGYTSRVEQLGIVVAVWALQMIASMLWIRWFDYGPVEYLWRRMTYGGEIQQQRL